MGLLSGITVMVVDTETTGFSPKSGDRVVEVAYTTLSDGVIGESWSSLVNPARPIPEGAARIHGITDAVVASAPPAGKVGAELRKRLGDLPLAFHNAPFDLPFLAQLFQEAGAPPLFSPIVDTLGLARGLYPGGANGLRPLAAKLGLQAGDKHRAGEDTALTALLLIHCAQAWERDRGIRTFAELAAVSQDIERTTRRR